MLGCRDVCDSAALSMTHPPLILRYWQYLSERFHPAQFTLLAVLIGGVLLLGSVGDVSKLPDLSSMLTASVALFLFLLRLRIFDEFKDHAHDMLHYPERPLPRGLVSKRELRLLLLLVWGGELICVFIGGYGVAAVYGIALAYSLLMYKEFFLRSWLRERFTLYVVSHELLVIPLYCYIASFAVPATVDLYSPRLVALIMFSGAQLFLLEVTRKVRTAEHEVASRDTYTAQYGVRGAGTLVFFTAFFSVVGLTLYERLTTGGAGISALLGSILLLVLVSVLRTFIAAPTARHAKNLFYMAIVLFSATHIVFILNAYLSV